MKRRADTPRLSTAWKRRDRELLIERVAEKVRQTTEADGWRWTERWFEEDWRAESDAVHEEWTPDTAGRVLVDFGRVRPNGYVEQPSVRITVPGNNCMGWRVRLWTPERLGLGLTEMVAIARSADGAARVRRQLQMLHATVTAHEQRLDAVQAKVRLRDIEYDLEDCFNGVSAVTAEPAEWIQTVEAVVLGDRPATDLLRFIPAVEG
jgi:hypothetical protein